MISAGKGQEPSPTLHVPSFAGVLTVALGLLCAASFDAAAEAQVTYLNVDRQVSGSAYASDQNDQDYLASQGAGLIGIDVSASGPPGTSGHASASQNLVLTPTGLQASGSYSAVTSTDCCPAEASSGNSLLVRVWYQGTSGRAFTVTGSGSAQADKAQPATSDVFLNAFGQGVTFSEGAQTVSFSGFMQPGRTYTVQASVRGRAGRDLSPEGTARGQSSSGSFSIEVEFATTEIDCQNGFDDDGDGLIDDDDPDCAPPPPPEICDNGIDDNGNGLIDGADPACYVPVGLQVRCMHEPIYPQDGETVRLYALAIDENGDTVTADRVQIVQANPENVVSTGTNNALSQHFFVPSTTRFSYGCRAERGTEAVQSWLENDQLRVVDVGTPELPTDKYQAIPVWLNGPVNEKNDIVFLHDRNQYSSYLDPDFISAVTDLVAEGIFATPWFTANQAHFNIWIGMADDAEASQGETAGDKCDTRKPAKYRKFYGFAEGVGIVHRTGPAFSCRDWSSTKMFTVEADPVGLQIAAHELGHALFGLTDEYCGATNAKGKCRGIRFTSAFVPPQGFLPPYPNLYPSEILCRSESVNDGFDPDACRQLELAQIGPDFWIREADYSLQPRLQQVQDLMQQTGAKTNPDGTTIDFHRVGPSERRRMDWVIDVCRSGKC